MLARPLALALFALCPALAAQGIGRVPHLDPGDAVIRPNDPPVVTSTLSPGTVLLPGHEVRFELTVTDPDGDPVSLKLLNHLPGIGFDPVPWAPSPLTCEVRWTPPGGPYVRDALGGIHHLVFVARSARGDRTRVRRVETLTIDAPQSDQNLLVGDVTGDGILDVVGATPKADVGGVVDQGAVYVWAGATVPAGTPTATLTVPGLASGDELGRTADHFFGSLTLGGQGVQLHDVTEDGVLDVVAVASLADVGGVVDAGAVYVWQGGMALSGTPAPHATLVAPSPVATDRLGQVGGEFFTNTGYGPYVGTVNPKFADVTGDGREDVIVGAMFKDLGGKGNTGAIYVWAGGTVSGTPAPHATLQVPVAGSLIGDGYAIRDVTGDGVCDVIDCQVRYANPSTITSAGLFVWEGGAGLTGDVQPSASLTVPPALMADPPRELAGFADVTGDGQIDIVASNDATSVYGPVDAGIVHVWAGGQGLLSATGPTATLRPSVQQPDTHLGRHGVRFADVTGDGTLDVVCVEPFNSPSPTFGSIHVWEGGAALSGTPAPRASMSDARLADAFNRDFLQFAELTGDGVLDLVASGDDQVLVFAGGATLTGTPVQTARLLTDPASYGQRSIHIESVTADGDLDLVIGGYSSDGLDVYEGGPGLSGQPAPVTTLRDPAGALGHRLGWSDSSRAIHFADVTGDGLREVIAIAPYTPDGANPQAGTVYVWETGLDYPNTTTAPTAILRIPNPPATGTLTEVWTGGGGLQFADLDGDGVLDVLAGNADDFVDNVPRVGTIRVWKGRAGLAGELAPDATFQVSGGTLLDRLGALRDDGGPFTGGCGILLADVTGDGKLDIVAGAAEADANQVIDSGAIYVFRGTTAAGVHAPLSTLLVPTAVAGDRLAY